MRVLIASLALSLVAAPLLGGCKPQSREPGAGASAGPATAATPPGAAQGGAGAARGAPPLSPDAMKGSLPAGHPAVDGTPNLPSAPGKTGALPAGHPPMGGGDLSPGAATGPALKYAAPSAWKVQKPASAMRKAQFGIPGAAGDAELVVFHFPGTGGDTASNLSRWHAQFTQPDGKSSAAAAKTEAKTVNGLKVSITTLTGNFAKPKDPMSMNGPTENLTNQGLWGAIVEAKGGPWFFKAIGPAATLTANAAAFDELVKSFAQ